mgnify:CR=1 FL=1
MTLAEQKAVVDHTSEAFSDTEPNVVTEAAKAVLKDSEARGGGVQMLGVDKIYPGSTVKALDDFNLEINPGEMVVLLGGSGCGKSTLLQALGGLDAPTSGKVLLEGQDLYALPDAALARLRRTGPIWGWPVPGASKCRFSARHRHHRRSQAGRSRAAIGPGHR